MRPLHPKTADKHYVVGEEYVLSEFRDRSDKSHNQFFACVHWAWENLPDDQTEQFPTAEHLRARALIACGYSTSRQFVASNNAQAVRLAAFIGYGREYSVVSVNDNVVTELSAASQARSIMGNREFQASKEAVIDYCAALVGVTSDELVKASKVDWEKRKAAKK